MTLDNQLLLIFSAFGSLNGAIAAGYIFILSKQRVAQIFLSLMLLMISIRIFKSVLFFFNPEVDKLILQVGLSACFLIGPFLYFYVSASRGNLTVIPIRWRIHLLFLATLVIGIGWWLPYAIHPEIWGTIIYKAINYSWFIYLLLSCVAAKPYILKALNNGKHKLTEDEVVILTVLVGNGIIWLAYFTASYTSYIVGALSFSFVLLLSLLLVFFKFNHRNIPTNNKYGDHKFNDSEASASLSKLQQLMTEPELFKDPNITMPQIARKIGMSSPKFSQLLNEKLNKSFTLYINEFRIAKAQQLLSEQPKQNLDAIADQCGFNSSSTFYSVFKKQTGLTPAKYRMKISLK